MSTIKSSSADLTLNADGSGNDIIFQSNASQVGSLTAEGALTATSASFSTADNSDTLTLTSTAANAGQGPNLRLYRNSGSPADSDILGMIDFEGRNDNSQDYIAAQIETLAADVSDGTEDGYMNLSVMLGGTLRSRIEMDANELVINEAGQDLDFRVESDGAANMFVIDAADNKIGIGLGGVSSVQYGVHINTADQGNLPTLQGDADDLVIENSTPGITLMGAAGGGGMIAFGDTDDADIAQIFYYHVSNYLQFIVNGSVHFKIASNGDLLATDTSIGSLSDERVKENISDLTYDVAKFKQLRPRTFDWKNPAGHDGRSGNKGFIAQEIEAVDDYWVGEDTIPSTHADYGLLDSIIRSNAVIDNGRIIAHGISESAWETGKSNNTYPADSTWAASAEDERITKISTLGKKDAMYISVINQLITRIESLETKVTALENA